jgi:hypothetical protein
MKEKLISTVTTALLTATSLVSAGETDSLSGSIGLGVIVIDAGNNLNPEESKKRLDNLSSAAKKETTLLFGILPEMTWDVGEPEGMKFYLATDPPIDEVGGFALSVGATIPFMSVKTLSYGLD